MIKWHLETTQKVDFLCVKPKIGLLQGNDSAQTIRLYRRAHFMKPMFVFRFDPVNSVREGLCDRFKLAS